MEPIKEQCPTTSDESARMAHPIEWWFVQGRFEGLAVEPREFMVSLFRHRLEWAGHYAGDVCMLLVSVLDPQTGQHHCLSRIDPATPPFLVLAMRASPLPGFDPLAMRAVVDEIADYGPAKAIHVEKVPPQFQSGPFQVNWTDFELQQTAGGFDLQFAEPDTGRRFSLRLRPRHPRIHLEKVQAAAGGAMDYASYTRLALDGGVDGAPVKGQAWFDHQWGDQGWFMAGDSKERMLGWDWLGIQLDDGRDLLVIVHRDEHSGQQVSQLAVEVDASGAVHHHRDFSLTPLSWWRSHRTETSYPIRWRLDVPAADLRLEFEPLAEDQEVAVLPPIRAIWEGAGRVSGTSRGRTINGHARLELHGYAYVLDLDKSLQSITSRIRGHIADFLPRTFTESHLARWAGTMRGGCDAEAQTAMVATPLWDLMDRGGKHWRPIFGILMLEAMGADPRPFEQLITITTEILHDASLIIDDIQDHGKTRRGSECVHLKFGTDVAIHAANTAYFMPLILLRDHPGLDDGQRLGLFRTLANLYMGAHLGQGQDIYMSKHLTADGLASLTKDEEQIGRQLLRCTQKTAAVVEAAAEGAAIIARAGPELRAACGQFGRVLGIAFQIINDVVDFSSSRIKAGEAGSDVREGKATHVILRAMQCLDDTARQRLAVLVCTPELRAGDDAVAEAVRLILGSGALEKCQQEARSMVEAEWRNLSLHLPPSEAKQMLRVLWTFLLGLADDETLSAYAPGN